MGIDIHLWVEKRVGDAWRAVAPPSGSEFERHESSRRIDPWKWGVEQEISVLSALGNAGIRRPLPPRANRTRPPVGSWPVVPRRGLPEDLSSDLARVRRDLHEPAYCNWGASWGTLQEIREWPHWESGVLDWGGHVEIALREWVSRYFWGLLDAARDAAAARDGDIGIVDESNVRLVFYFDS